MRKVVVVAVVLGVLGLAPSAHAAIPSVFGGAVACTEDTDGVRECGSSSPRSTVATFDGIPIDVNVAFPPEPAVGPDGNFPLIIWGHGYGGGKIGFDAMRRFTDRGYAVFSMTTRGFRESCGSPASQTAAAGACADGYVRLMDTRFEVRDAQHFAGLLADEERIDPQRIGALGGSYGGGLSMALGALKDRIMLPDGTLAQWESPGDEDAMRIAGATPNIPWTDLVYSLVPNGSTLDYLARNPYTRSRFGVMKESLVTGLYLSGQGAPGYYVTPGQDDDADLTSWFARLNAGEPYDGDPVVTDVVDELTTHHSSYYIDDSTPPAPMLISSGFTDDLFPADEALRFYNRTRTEHEGTPISLFFGDFGHQRAANKAADAARLRDREDAWLDFYVKGGAPAPFQGVEALTQTCPNSAPSAGPVSAPTWAAIAPGEVRFASEAAKTLTPGAGSQAIATTFNPVTAGGPCGTAPGTDQQGVASYRLPQVDRAFVLMGAATVVATIDSAAANSQVAARLLDVAPNGTETLVSRALLRPPAGNSRQVFQLHPNGWEFKAGHTPKLELLPRDSGGAPLTSYARQSNGQGPVTVSDLQLRLPVLERPGTDGGYVKAPAPKVLPEGTELAGDFANLPRRNARVLGGKVRFGQKGARIAAPEAWVACHAFVKVFGKVNGKRRLLAKGRAKIAGGESRYVKLSGTKKGKRALAGKRKLKVQVQVRTLEQTGKVTAKGVLVPKKR